MQNETPPQISEDERRARREARQTWYGCLADDNVEHIATRIRRLLKGQYYTVMTNNADYDFAMPHLQTGQFLVPYTFANMEKSDGISVSRIGDQLPFGDPGERSESCGINIHDSYGSYGIRSSFATEHEAMEARHSQDLSRRRWTTYLTIAGGHSDDPREIGALDRIEIEQYNFVAEPQVLQWVFAPERRWDDYGPDQYKEE